MLGILVSWVSHGTRAGKKHERSAFLGGAGALFQTVALKKIF